jgi:hypothetical protein
MNKNERELEIMDLVCAPEATDDLADIEFDDDEAAEQDFIEGWIQEEIAYNAEIAKKMKGTEEK